jgi:hypothetical protein
MTDTTAQLLDALMTVSGEHRSMTGRECAHCGSIEACCCGAPIETGRVCAYDFSFEEHLRAEFAAVLARHGITS